MNLRLLPEAPGKSSASGKDDDVTETVTRRLANLRRVASSAPCGEGRHLPLLASWPSSHHSCPGGGAFGRCAIERTLLPAPGTVPTWGCIPFVSLAVDKGGQGWPQVSALVSGVRMFPRMWNCSQALKPQLWNLHGGTSVAATGIWGFDIWGYPEGPWHKVTGH